MSAALNLLGGAGTGSAELLFLFVLGGKFGGKFIGGNFGGEFLFLWLRRRKRGDDR